jgi:hypothetical protein
LRRLIQDVIAKPDYPTQLLGLFAGVKFMKKSSTRTLISSLAVSGLAAIRVAAPAFRG